MLAEEVFQSISDETVDAFWRDGAVCLRGVIDLPWQELIALGIEETLAKPTPYGRVQSKADDPGFFFTDYYMWRHYEAFEKVHRQGPGGAIAARLTGSEAVNFFFDGLFVKEPGTERATDWHQDQPYYNVDGEKLCVIWIPIDPVKRHNALSFIKGSHRWQKWYRPFFFANDRELDGYDEAFESVPPDLEERADLEILAWDMEPGDCAVFHPLTLHGAKGNDEAQARRRAISTTWLGDDAVYGERGLEVEPKIEGLKGPLQIGQRLDFEPVFPKVWPRGEQSP